MLHMRGAGTPSSTVRVQKVFSNMCQISAAQAIHLFEALLCLTLYLAPQAQAAASDAQIMQEATLVLSVGRVDLFEHRTAAPPKLAAVADLALKEMENTLGLQWDEATLGARVKVYVSSETKFSHVLGGYDHRDNPQPVLFLNPQVARRAVLGVNATYAHELAHLLTWRFHSHTLREGLADYLALQLHPDAGVGPNSDGHTVMPEWKDQLSTLIGTSAPPPAAVTEDKSFRESYYASSYRFVRYLIEIGGLATFMQLYATPDLLPAYTSLYGKTREALLIEALK